MLPILEIEAKERQRAAGEKYGRGMDSEEQSEKVVANLPQPISEKSRDAAAQMTGASPRYVSDAKKLKEERPEKFEQVKSGEKTISEVKAEIKREAKLAVAAELNAKPLPTIQSVN